MVEMGEDMRRMPDDDDVYNSEDCGERKLLSRYGIWLLVELCKPGQDIPIVSATLSNTIVAGRPRLGGHWAYSTLNAC